VYESSFLPKSNRVGVLIATVLLAYALTRLIQTPEFTLEFQLTGFYFAYSLSLSTVMLILTAGLTATGMDWLLNSHPGIGQKQTIEYWLLPTLATFIIGISLTILPVGAIWWIGFGIGGLLLLFLFQAEYTVVDPSASSYALATAGLTALSYAVFVILTTAVRYNGVRLFVIAPILLVVSGMVSLRNLHLRVGGKWKFTWALGIGFLCMQVGAGLHYWPVSPVQFGLALFGLLYAMTTIAGSLLENVPLRRAIIEPILVLALACSVAVLLP
jgi:hypothetical protein